MITAEQVREAIRPVMDPEMMLSIVDLGLVYGIEVEDEGKKVNIDVTLTSPACPVGPQIINGLKQAAESLEGVGEAHVNLVWEPQWDPRTMATDEVKDILGIW